MTPRELDERDLAWLAARQAGLTADQIAGRYGVGGETVKARTLAIRNADLIEAKYWGDTMRTVMASYWDSAAMRNAGRRAMLR